ncbi:response regulator [Dyadobacter luticola]|uniref:Response regulator transcription factor n=1 Tax=Dyadobacter luticola TaxID=1979387 RepID=A0A5R9L4F3_9BACT|nr:response regulator transcription factor [Dyadobacter luticola]TLV03423.1 response regulator transcription factor [Dyadobacter luticola]
MKHILIFDNYYIVRAALSAIVEGLPQDISTAEATSLTEMFAELSAKKYDLVILEAFMPEGSGISIIERIKKVQPDARILIFSTANESFYATFYLKAGANGFLSKNAARDEIECAISTVLDTGNYLSNAVSRQLISNLKVPRPKTEDPLKGLSAREVEVMDLLVEGLWLKEIAHQLNLTESSVSTYKARIFGKLHVSNVIELYRKVNFFKNQTMAS